MTSCMTVKPLKKDSTHWSYGSWYEIRLSVQYHVYRF
jgi:hypothetical protein